MHSDHMGGSSAALQADELWVGNNDLQLILLEEARDLGVQV